MNETNHQVYHCSAGYQPSGPRYPMLGDGSHRSTEEAERVERMAGRMIEQAMTAVVVRKCWNCQRRFVKTTGCSQVECVCGASTCHRCGGRMEHRHRCQRWLPLATWTSIRRAARAAKGHLRLRYPGLRFKYDPSRRLSRKHRKRNRKN